ncbi:MAG: class I SAM-dependent methyltransferase [Polyangiaceae bacterium]|nr:class I SAM-dependent methyltransferase [Polyangiaceae bacterium]
MELERLTDRQHWDEASDQEEDWEGPRRAGWLAIPYEHHVLWNHLYARHLPRRKGIRAVEIGSAPGSFLVELAHRYGYEPWGFEYSTSGVLKNRAVFERHGHDPSHVIQGDFFSDSVIEPFVGFFDVVISRGFVEHFTDVPPVVRRHVDLLSPGGTLVVAIPRFRGVYWAWMSTFDREDLARHNLAIMRLKDFGAAFDDPRLERLFCGYYGALPVTRFQLRSASTLSRSYNKGIRYLQLLLNGMFRVLLPAPGLRSELFSPFLIYVGRRRTEPPGSLGEES